MCQSDGYRRIVRGENPTNAAVVGKKKKSSSEVMVHPNCLGIG